MTDARRHKRFYSKDLKGITLDQSGGEGDALFSEEADDASSNADLRMQYVIKYVTENTDLSPKKADVLAREIFDQITLALKKGEDVKIPKFGTFTKVSLQGRPGRHPRTGKAISIPAHTQPRFKASKKLRDALN